MASPTLYHPCSLVSTLLMVHATTWHVLSITTILPSHLCTKFQVSKLIAKSHIKGLFRPASKTSGTMLQTAKTPALPRNSARSCALGRFQFKRIVQYTIFEPKYTVRSTACNRVGRVPKLITLLNWISLLCLIRPIGAQSICLLINDTVRFAGVAQYLKASREFVCRRSICRVLERIMCWSRKRVKENNTNNKE